MVTTRVKARKLCLSKRYHIVSAPIIVISCDNKVDVRYQSEQDVTVIVFKKSVFVNRL